MSDNPKVTYPLKRFLVFTGCAYYADGGALDLRGSNETRGGATSWILSQPRDADHTDYEDGMSWCHVLDLETGLIVAYVSGMCWGSIKDHDRDRIAEDVIVLGDWVQGHEG